METVTAIKKPISFDGFTLKMVAIIAMVIDHTRYLFFDNFSDKLYKGWHKWGVVIFFAAAAFFLQFDGIFTTVPMIFLMNKYHDNFKKMVISVAILLLSLTFMQIIMGLSGLDRSQLTNIFTWIRPLARLSFLFIQRYNGQRGRNM